MKTNSPIGVYLHVPFCRKKCSYCDFYSAPPTEPTLQRYAKGIQQEIAQAPDAAVDTLYFGGGTPTLLPLPMLESILSQLHGKFSIDKEAEITIEANPDTVSESRLKTYRDLGFNRISFGVQSMQDKELQALERLHSAKQAASAAYAAEKAGFGDISLDLMLGIPYQTNASFADTFQKIRSLPITHLSIYMLKREKGTPLYTSPLLSFCADEDDLADLYLDAVALAEANGFRQYEISNFAREGYACKHNLKYWNCQEFLGFGPSAYSFYNRMRYGHTRDLTHYCLNPAADRTDLDPTAGSLQEKWMLKLRLTEGIPEEAIENQAFLRKLITEGLARRNGTQVSLTPRGMLVSNFILSRLIYRA